MARIRNKHWTIAFFTTLAVSLGLIIASMCIPPTGKIDPSVLEATGIIFLWPCLAFANKALEEGRIAKVQKGDTTITIGTDEDGDGEIDNNKDKYGRYDTGESATPDF